MTAGAVNFSRGGNATENLLKPFAIPLYENIAGVLYFSDVFSKQIGISLVEQVVPFARPKVLVELLELFGCELSISLEQRGFSAFSPLIAQRSFRLIPSFLWSLTQHLQLSFVENRGPC